MKIGSKPQAAAAPVPIPRRDDVLKEIRAEQALRKRRGGVADILTGSAGAEPGPIGVKQLLGI